jgi:hypothetical protein
MIKKIIEKIKIYLKKINFLKIKKKSKKFYKKYFKKNIFLIIIVVVFFYNQNNISNFFSFKPKNKNYELKLQSANDMLIDIKTKWEYYAEKLSSEEIEIIWYNNFKNVEYRSGGVTEKFGTADCVDAVYMFLRKLGYPGMTRNVPETKSLAQQLNKAGLIIFKPSKDAKCGDIIIFKPINGIAHIGIVTTIKNGYILYVDVNGSIGMGLREKIIFSDYRIDIVFSPSWEFWIYDWNKKENKS